jgi:hypothetical protein
MKKLIVCLTVAAFAMVSSVQAGEKTTKAAAATCETTAKASCSVEVKTACCGGKSKKITAKIRSAQKGATLLALR